MSCPLAWSKLDRYGSHIFACLHETVLGEMELLSMSYKHEVPPHGEENPFPLRSSCARVRVAPERHDPSTSALLVVTFLHVCLKTGVLGRLRLPTHCFCTSCPSSRSFAIARSLNMCHNSSQPRCGLGLLGVMPQAQALRHLPA